MNQIAAERDAQELCIRYVSGPRNQLPIWFQSVEPNPTMGSVTLYPDSQPKFGIIVYAKFYASLQNVSYDYQPIWPIRSRIIAL
jgi:hypothetical protein